VASADSLAFRPVLPARRGGSTAERVEQPARRLARESFRSSLAEEEPARHSLCGGGSKGSADESTTGPASLMLIDRSRLSLPAEGLTKEGRQPAELEEQSGGKNVRAADLPGADTNRPVGDSWRVSSAR
jgi:hypothetical protein